MQETLITFETAKLAKEKSFSWKCRGKIHCSHYHLVKDNIIPSNVPTSSTEMFAPLKDWNNYLKPKLDTETSLPTQSLLQKWLREKYNIDVFTVIEPYSNEYRVVVYNKNKQNYTEFPKYYKTFEEALEIGLQEGLKLIP